MGGDLLLSFEPPVEALDVTFLIAYLVLLSHCLSPGPGSPSASESIGIPFRCALHHLETSYLTANALDVLIRSHE